MQCSTPPPPPKKKEKKERGLHEIVAMAMYETTANKLHQQTFNSYFLRHSITK